MKVEKIDLSKIVPYEKNIKRHSDDQIKKIADSIKDVGFIQPIVVDENFVILIGHWRFEALKFMGETQADCVVLKWLSEEQKKALRIRDNKLNESPYDISNLASELQDLFDKNIDLQTLWFSIQELETFDLKIDNKALDDLAEQVSTNEVENQNLWNTEWNDQQNNGEETAYNFSQMQWNVSWERHPITFYLNDADYNLLGEFYKTSRKWESNVELLREVTNFYLENHQTDDENSD